MDLSQVKNALTFPKFDPNTYFASDLFKGTSSDALFSYHRLIMRPKKHLNLLFTYSIITCAISLVSLVRLTAIFAMRLTDTNIAIVFKMALFSLLSGLLTPGILILLGLQYFFHLLLGIILNLFIGIPISLIPWIIFGFSIHEKQKNKIVFVGLFILTYTLCGALAFMSMLMMIEELR